MFMSLLEDKGVPSSGEYFCGSFWLHFGRFQNGHSTRGKATWKL